MPKKSDMLTESAVSMTAAITDLVKMRRLAKQSEEVSELKHYTMLKNVDRMLSKLPDDVVEDLGMQFMDLTYKAIKNQK